MTEKGKIFLGYVKHVIHHHEFGSNKMVNVGPVYFTVLDDCSASLVLNELIEEGWLREYTTIRTFSRGSRGFSVKNKVAFKWIGVTPKGWSVAPKYLKASETEV